MNRKSGSKTRPGQTTIAISDPVYALLREFVAERGMVLRIAAERAITVGIETMKGVECNALHSGKEQR